MNGLKYIRTRCNLSLGDLASALGVTRQAISSWENDTRVCFLGDNELRLDEQYLLAQQKQKELIQEIENIIKWSDNMGSIKSQIVSINRGCKVYEITTQLMQAMREEKSIMKMAFFYELMNVWKAMLVGYDLLDETELGKENEYKTIIKETNKVVAATIKLI